MNEDEEKFSVTQGSPTAPLFYLIFHILQTLFASFLVSLATTFLDKLNGKC